MYEIWKPISLNGFEGLYEVSNIGRVRSVDREFIKSNGRKQPVKSKILNQTKDKYGYPKVYLSNRGFENNVTVHRLVANAFIPNPKNLPQVNHINSIRHDNRVDNLEWVTGKQNSEHAYTYGHGKRGLEHVNSRQIGLYHNDQIISVFETVTKCSEVLGLNKGNLRKHIKSGIIFDEIGINYLHTKFDEHLLNKYPFKRKLNSFQSKPVIITNKVHEILGVYENRLIAERINDISESCLMPAKSQGTLYKNTYYIKSITQYKYLTYDNENFINKKIQ